MRSILLMISLLIIYSAAIPAQAQDLQNMTDQQSAYSAGTDLNRTIRDFEKFKMDRELSEKLKKSQEIDKSETPEQEKPPQIPVATVFLQKVRFSQSSVLSAEQLKSFAAEYESRNVGIAELYELVNKINQWYRLNGYITAIAALPPQKILDGKLDILLVEGKVGRVAIHGNATTRSDYISDRVNIPTGQLLSIKPLDRHLLWFNGTNDIKLKIKLQAGTEPGTTDYLIEAVEPAETLCSIFTDTSGNSNTGMTRSGISYTNSSFSGIRDSLNMTAMFSKSSRTGFLSYNRPINKLGSKLSLYTSMNQLNVYQDDLNGFNIKGESRSTGLTLSIPQVVKMRYKEELILDIQKQTSLNKVLGMIFVDDDEQRYSLGKSFLKLSPGEAFYCRPVYTYCKYSGLGEDKYKRKFVVDGLWQKVRKQGQLLNLKLNWQRTDDEYLPSADQYYLGGSNSVRGYNESVLGGDAGLNIKSDYFFPVPGFRSTQLNIFYDWGRIYGRSLLTTQMIHSAGLGVKHSFAADSFVAVTLGFPFVRRLGDENIASHKVDLSVNMSF